ncbi:hypothetical protein CHLRE_02g098300v5 [Chlamydomonas reinhardtii]|uniref:Kinetochore protein NDC80 n=1 Tax=Chlamydomonas reinhardtii TaxID=3055 RepID=A0A2K3E237_CHLRE|nr:uncharacterized protein CHLRE_02g098300v5 [Chlamydomonas reinhardtii]PNW86849.1 hypothetical protein CHLRE_02g098300v5 [Chlamydomonas reinhardtii]
MSRRQTLANVSPSQLNAKLGGNNAAGPGRSAKDPPGALPAKGRKSMAVGMVADRPSAVGAGLDPRRSSAFGTKPSGPKQDPRPLSSKDYQASCIRAVITYLSTHNFPAAVAPKTLASPTGKDFATIVTFLFQQVDPTFRIQGKVEDEVPVFFKRLNYPFQISKSALFAVGSPHSWPAVLAALTWLVELLNYMEKADDNAGSAFERENKVEQEFLDYLSAGYGAFMSGNDDRCQQLDDELAAKFTAREGDLVARCEQLKRANAEVLAELERLRSLPDPVVVAQQQREEQLVDMQKFEQLIQNLQGLKQTLTRKLSEKKSDLQAKQDQIAGAVADVEQLRQRVASQTINKADLNRMIMERNKQNEMLNSEKEKCEQMECKVHEQEVQIVHRLTALESTVERYNKLAHRLKLIPATSKRADGTNYELRINRDSANQAEFSSLDLKGVVKPGLERLCEMYRTRASELSQDLISLREACVARAERNVEKKEENAALEGEIARLEAQLQAAKDAHEEKCRRLVAQADSIKAQVDEFRSAASNRTEHMEERLSRVQAAYEQTKRDSEAELSRLESDLKAAMQMLIAHKEAVGGAISRAAGAVRQVKAELAAGGAPRPVAVA